MRTVLLIFACVYVAIAALQIGIAQSAKQDQKRMALETENSVLLKDVASLKEDMGLCARRIAEMDIIIGMMSKTSGELLTSQAAEIQKLKVDIEKLKANRAKATVIKDNEPSKIPTPELRN